MPVTVVGSLDILTRQQARAALAAGLPCELTETEMVSGATSFPDPFGLN